jgi:uncharacterized protein (TIGR02598 family)
MKRNLRGRCAFSLVEVVIALGLFSFCIVAITGLLSVGLGSTRSVVNEGVAVNLAGSVYGAWEAQTNRTENLTVPGLFTNLPPLSDQVSTNFFFDQSGVQVQDAAQGALQMDYVATPSGAAPMVTTLDLVFTWPVGGATNAIQTRSYSRVFVK